MAASTLATGIFKSGNSLAVRTPKDITPAEVPEDAEINYSGAVWTIRPIYKRKLTGLTEKFGAFLPGHMSEGREPQDQEQDIYDWALAGLSTRAVAP
jgi:virulence-associated protein VagC